MNRFLQIMAVISLVSCSLSGVANLASRRIAKGIILLLVALGMIGILLFLRSVSGPQP